MIDVTHAVDTTADPTQAGQDALLAWSLETEPEATVDPTLDRPWPQAGILAAAMLLVGAVVAAAAWYVHLTPVGVPRPPTVVQASPPPAPAPPDAPTLPVVLPTPPDAGHKLLPPAPPRAAVPPLTGAALFNQLMSRAGIDAPSDPRDAESSANMVGQGICGQLADGWTDQEAANNILAHGHFGNGAAPTPAQARAFVEAAEQAYCPRVVG
jgi:hypothetical protein